MPTQQKQTGPAPKKAGEYTGKRTKTGNSSGFRFEGAFFKSHPEFSGDVRARVIAPGRLLVTAQSMEEQGSDPVIASFLAFLAQDMVSNPQLIRPFNQELADEIDSLVGGVTVDPNEDLGKDSLI